MPIITIETSDSIFINLHSILVTQDQSRSNSSGITVCVRLDNPPGQLFRDNILAFNDLQDGCMFDTDYNSSGNGLNSSRNYTYTLEDNSGNLTENVLCTCKLSGNLFAFFLTILSFMKNVIFNGITIKYLHGRLTINTATFDRYYFRQLVVFGIFDSVLKAKVRDEVWR